MNEILRLVAPSALLGYRGNEKTINDVDFSSDNKGGN